MGVATRKVKFIFSSGERVLCYEPDPTKAKVLYESKVLDLVVGRDERGRKVPEYLIHFFGWNSSWDRCVREEFILPYTEENRELQTKLAEDAALTIKGKRKSKLPPLIKETLNKKLCVEGGKEKTEQPGSPDLSSDSESSEEETEKEVKIEISEVLKKQLEEDRYQITKNNKFVKLPCKPNVVTILESFVKNWAATLLCASPPRNSKNGKPVMPDEVKDKLDLCKEAMDGIRVYFDFTLPHLLLYHQEKKQFFSEDTICSPVCNSNRVLEEKDDKPKFKVEEESADVIPNLPSSPKTELIPKTKPLYPVQTLRGKGRPSLRRRGNRYLKAESKTKNGSNAVPKISTKTEKSIKTPSRRRPKGISTRILRSSEKQKQSLETMAENQPIKETPQLELEVKPSTSSCPEAVLSKEPASHPVEIRVTRKSAQLSMSPPQTPSAPNHAPQSSFMSTGELTFSIPSASELQLHHQSQQQSPNSLSTTSNCMASSSSSGHSSTSSSKSDQEYLLINNNDLLQDINNWQLLPMHYYNQIPAAPSLIYGAQHLLRLFVKLPDLISKMKIPTRKLTPLLSILEKLLVYLTERKDQLFLPSAYVDFCDATSNVNYTDMK